MRLSWRERAIQDRERVRQNDDYAISGPKKEFLSVCQNAMRFEVRERWTTLGEQEADSGRFWWS